VGIGVSSNARCTNSISIGSGSDVLSSNTTAVGTSTCIGPSSNSSTAVGQFATVLSASSLAAGLGTCVGTCAANSLVLGCGSFIQNSALSGGADDSIVIGVNSKICDDSSASAFLGSCSNVVIGNSNQSLCINNTIIGKSNCAEQQDNVILGKSNCIWQSGLLGNQHWKNIAIGDQNFIQCSGTSTVIGSLNTTCSTTNLVNIGNNNAASGPGGGSIIIGRISCISGSNNIAIGSLVCNVGFSNNIAIGHESKILNQSSHTVVGYGTCAAATSIATAIYGATSKGFCDRSMAFGIQAESCAAHSLALGSCVISTRPSNSQDARRSKLIQDRCR
jgi:hypothetical protein